MQLFRIDAEHEEDDGSFSRYFRSQPNADRVAAWLNQFGWQTDCYPTDAPDALCDRLCQGIWPNAPDKRVFAVVRDAKAIAAADLQQILARKDRNRGQ